MTMESSKRRESLTVCIKIIVIVLLSINWYLLDNYLPSFGVIRDDQYERKMFFAMAGSGGVGAFTTLLILRFVTKRLDGLEAGFNMFWGVIDIVAGAWILIFLAPLSSVTPLDEMIRDGRVQFLSGMNFLFAGMLLLGEAISFMTIYL